MLAYCANQWTVSETGTSSRLPPLGPVTPLGTPLLLLVTHAHEIHVCQLPPFAATLKIVRASLLQPHAPDPQGSPPVSDSPGRIGGDRICMKAAIGLSYRGEYIPHFWPSISHTESGSTILVAMRSRLLPSQSSSQSLQNPLDLGLSLDMSQPLPPESPFLAEWELWGEESTISLCEVRLVYRIMVPRESSRHLC